MLMCSRCILCLDYTLARINDDFMLCVSTPTQSKYTMKSFLFFSLIFALLVVTGINKKDARSLVSISAEVALRQHQMMSAAEKICTTYNGFVATKIIASGRSSLSVEDTLSWYQIVEPAYFDGYSSRELARIIGKDPATGKLYLLAY